MIIKTEQEMIVVGDKDKKIQNEGWVRNCNNLTFSKLDVCNYCNDMSFFD